ncbi:uncharacterized protein LOC119602218 [Lucilia sericata]|uniref:uncharacterized protein LOC119602218 n=1 Tax=Lucilia sericata TaxID=13632 RepID=UPI0018A8135E|nr:uncharacterized protein LOC119602218 [Lucilia sericata]
MRSVWLLLLLSGQTALSHAWKPIVGQAPANAAITGSKATSTAFTSSFSLQQSHPEFGSKISYVSDSDTKEVQQPLAAELLAVKSNYKTPIAVPPVPSSINFGDARFGYKPTGYEEDQCSVKKYAFNQDGVVRYENKIPELSQFTICFWMRFTNHSGDHVILTYSTEDEHRDFQFWVANAKNSSFLSMAIKGQQMYRLNYPLRVRQWHHTCTSWNGKTGEWQVWLKAERIGRGFHNALVGHKIPAGGKLYSGGTSVTGKICDGLHFEVTLVQIYRVALSAGKAHRDHKHHHAHHFDHEGQEIQLTTKAPPPINRPQPMHTLLANGQIPTRVRINLAQPNQADAAAATSINQAAQQGLTIHTNFVNGQINVGSRLVAQQLIGLNHKLATAPQTTQTINRQPVYDPANPSNVQFVDETETRILFKRHAVSSGTKPDSANKDEDKTLKKRGLVFLEDGSIVNDPLVGNGAGEFKYDGLAEFGGQQFKHDLSGKSNIEDEIMEHDREPAEEEVKAVMSYCDACEVEPFQGAIVFAWKEAHEKLDNVLKGYSVGGCGQF